MCFSDRFKFLCDKEGIKPTPLIKSLGFSAGNIKRWENGATINSDILIKIAKHFNVSIDYLLCQTDNPNVNGNIINTGNIGDNNNSSVNINSEKDTKTDELDSTTLQIAKAFQDLDIFEKTEVMNLISKLSKK